MLLSEQIRAARMLLGWNQERLAEKSQLATGTVKRIEAKDGPLGGNAETVWKIQAAFEKAGIEFILGDGQKGPGVRLTKPYESNPLKEKN